MPRGVPNPKAPPPDPEDEDEDEIESSTDDDEDEDVDTVDDESESDEDEDEVDDVESENDADEVDIDEDEVESEGVKFPFMPDVPVHALTSVNEPTGPNLNRLDLGKQTVSISVGSHEHLTPDGILTCLDCILAISGEAEPPQNYINEVG